MGVDSKQVCEGAVKELQVNCLVYVIIKTTKKSPHCSHLTMFHSLLKLANISTFLLDIKGSYVCLNLHILSVIFQINKIGFIAMKLKK